jgi:hypothetical protein
VFKLRVDEEILVTCNVCQTHDHVRIENLLDHRCTNCDTSAIEIKQDRNISVLKEIDDAVEKLDIVIGSAMYGFMSSEEARDWIEHDANRISDTLNKAREYIEDMKEDSN